MPLNFRSAFKLSFLLAALFTSSLKAQRFTSSPYSRYGLGEMNYQNFAHTLGMGGTSIAFLNDTTSPFLLNVANPASYSGIKLTVFDAGVISNTVNLKSGSSEQILNNTSLAYLNFGFPVTKRWGLSAGLLPYSSIGYSISDQDTLDNVGPVKYSYVGTGGINKFFIGNAYTIIPKTAKNKNDLSLGFNGSYLFGTLDNTRQTSFLSGNYLNTKIVQSINVSDVTLDFGILFTHTIDSVKTILKDSLGITYEGKKDINDTKISFGLTASLPDQLKATSTFTATSFKTNVYGYDATQDTIANYIDKKGHITLPLIIGAGFSVKKGEKWILGADYSMQQWSKYILFDESGNLNNNFRVSIGGQYIPNKRSDVKGSYFKRVQYRAGFHYGNTSYALKGNQLNEYGLGLGFGLPLRKIKVGSQFTHSILNIGLELGRRGSTDLNLVEEEYAKVILSLTLNDRWFIRHKFN
jgi:hypothetical protein